MQVPQSEMADLKGLLANKPKIAADEEEEDEPGKKRVLSEAEKQDWAALVRVLAEAQADDASKTETQQDGKRKSTYNPYKYKTPADVKELSPIVDLELNRMLKKARRRSGGWRDREHHDTFDPVSGGCNTRGAPFYENEDLCLHSPEYWFRRPEERRRL